MIGQRGARVASHVVILRSSHVNVPAPNPRRQGVGRTALEKLLKSSYVKRNRVSKVSLVIDL